MNQLQTLLDRLEAASLPDEDRELAAAVAGDLAALTAAAAAGMDVTAEIAHVKAQVANLTAGSAARLQEVFRQWMTDLVSGLILATL